MAAWARTLTRFIHRQRRLVRGLLAVAALVLLIDGFLIERSLLHLLLLHPLLLMAPNLSSRVNEITLGKTSYFRARIGKNITCSNC